MAFNIWIRCELYGTTFSKIIEAVDASTAVENYVADIVARHGLNRRELAVCMIQPV